MTPLFAIAGSVLIAATFHSGTAFAAEKKRHVPFSSVREKLEREYPQKANSTFADAAPPVVSAALLNLLPSRGDVDVAGFGLGRSSATEVGVLAFKGDRSTTLNSSSDPIFPAQTTVILQQPKMTDFEKYINQTVRIQSMGGPGAWGATARPGQTIYAHWDDPVAWAPSVHNIRPMPTVRSMTDPVYKGESGIGIALFSVEFGPGSPRKLTGWGGHGLASYQQQSGPLPPDTIRAHSLGVSALDSLYLEGGYKAIEPFKGMTILGAGNSPMFTEKNHVAAGGYTGSFVIDATTRGIPWSLGVPINNPLRQETIMLSSRGLSGQLSDPNQQLYGKQPAQNVQEFVRRMNDLQRQGYLITHSPLDSGFYKFQKGPPVLEFKCPVCGQKMCGGHFKW